MLPIAAVCGGPLFLQEQFHDRVFAVGAGEIDLVLFALACGEQHHCSTRRIGAHTFSSHFDLKKERSPFLRSN